MEKLFRELGLDETEAKVYNALFELGPSTVTEITKRARITRTLGYHVLEKLEWYGLVGRAGGVGKKIKYAVEHPDSLVQFVKNKKLSWDDRIAKAEGNLAHLLTMYSVADKPTINYQQGIQGVISAHEEILETKDEVLTITDIDMWKDSEFWAWMNNFHQKRKHKNYQERMLLFDTPTAREYVKQLSVTNCQYRLISKQKVHGLAELGGEMHIYGGKVLIAIFKKPNRLGMIVESQVFSNMLRAVFELAWQSAEPVEKGK